MSNQFGDQDIATPQSPCADERAARDCPFDPHRTGLLNQ